MVMNRIEHAVMWRRLDGPGHDVCTFGPTEAGWRLQGSAVFVSGGAPCSLGYLVDADAGWRIRSAHAFGTIGTELVDAFITAVDGGPWLLAGRRQYRTAGCLDLDFGFTPATKLFILRRLASAIGGPERTATVAQLALPALTLEPMEQRYQRVTDVDYVFATGVSSQRTVLRVDRHHSVVHYPGLWERADLTGARAGQRSTPVARRSNGPGRREEQAEAF
jgi:hypothetical protein